MGTTSRVAVSDPRTTKMVHMIHADKGEHDAV